VPNGISGGGNTSLGEEAFIWDPTHGIRLLSQVLTEDGIDLTGLTLQEATGVSADGNTIVGYGRDPGNHIEGWVATIPEPGTGLLVMAGVLGLAVKRRHV